MSQTNPMKALDAVIGVIYDTVKECPDGAPSGIVYAALMGVGIDLTTYNMILAIMMKRNLIRQSNYLLYAIDKPANVE